MPKLMRPIQARGDGPHVSIDGARQSPRYQPIAPFREIIFRSVFEL
jgi:hypothetical protein